MPTYNKLVRDKIPEIIEDSGKTCQVSVLDRQMYIKELKKKIVEEINEYLQAKDDAESIEELADVLEIIHSLSEIHGVSFKNIEEVRQKKHQERGGFDDRVFLIEVMD